DADDDRRPRAIDAEALAEGGDDFLSGIADAGLAKIAKIGEVFADLGVGDAERLAQLAAGGGLRAFAEKALQVAEVTAEAMNAGSRQPRFMGSAAGRGTCWVRLA